MQFPNVTTCLHFPGTAEDAVNTYLRIFPNARMVSVMHYGEGAPLPAGTPMFFTFELNGTLLQAINGIADWPYTGAMSLMARCKDQPELDRVWEALLEGGGETMACGWLKDRFGVHWQIVPEGLDEMMASDDEAATTRLMTALWGMVKVNAAELQSAFKGP